MVSLHDLPAGALLRGMRGRGSTRWRRFDGTERDARESVLPACRSDL